MRSHCAEVAGMLTWSSNLASVMSIGRLITRPNAPCSLCSQIYVRVLEKCGSAMLGMAIRKWCVRFTGCIVENLVALPRARQSDHAIVNARASVHNRFLRLAARLAEPAKQ